ncbi:rho GTPase-activating protein 21 isoform X2 [Lucilia sericata]|uniref:rho GTPase-activating protein 21 isoform X2 n=1 Tax=Lucilia sericata TaxID=13632 RepID=UPI0018A80CEF|nr:rho GTPase-activating protein 21 isoform X2 [Lucilia sericata]
MLQNTSTSSTAGQQQMPQPKLVVIRRRPNQGFGFTLRHFIAYPPEDDPSWPQEASEPYQVKAMETIFIKEVHPNGPAYYANLQTGDRVLMVNNTPIAGIAYSNIVSMIKQTPSELKLLVVPKECDVLQMHYTSIAHTPQSNVTNVGNGNSASSASNNTNTNFPSLTSSSTSSGALLPLSVAMVGKPFPVQHQQHQLISFPASQQASRSGSITSTNSLRPLTNSDYMDIATAQSYHHQQQQQQHQQQQLSGNILTHSDSGSYLRSPPANLTVLTRQQQLQQQQNAAAFYASNAAVDTSDLMIRLRESIKQKEEFLKSPLPNVHQQHSNSQHQQHQQQQQQHFFPNTPPSGSPQLSMISTSSTSVGSSGLGGAIIRNNEATARGQVRTLVKQPLSATSSSSSTRELLTASCDMHYAPNLGSSTSGVGSGLVGVGGGASGMTTYGTSGTPSVLSRGGHLQQQRSSATSSATNGSSSVVSTLRDKYHHKDYEFLETLQETGVTNKVFESKLNSHLSRGFDPFKTLSINTNTIESTSAPGNVIMMKKPGVLYDSLQHHPLAQMQVQQQQPQQQQQHHMPQQHHQVYQQTTAPKMTIIPIAVDAALKSSSSTTPASTTIPTTTTTTNQASTSTVDGHRYSRMEIHKASLATATIDHQTNSTSTMTDLTEINKSSATPVTRRFRPMSSFDEPKHMRRISYLRATNDDYHCETSLSSSSVTNTSTGSVNDSLSTKSATVLSQQIEEHPDPIYDVVSGGGGGDSGAADSTSESLDALEDLKLETSSRSSRRTSVNSDIRHSVHIDSIPSIDITSKFETKDVATEMEIFETEMEIKSTCINGKRLSEYRSWRQVKIEIKGDILKIYPSRNTKSDNNIIELDIRNYKIFDETDKKKYVFRMQSKPSPIATLGNELNLDDTNDKLTSSSGSSTNVPQQSLQHTDTQYQPHTEIFFKTKSSTEMRRIFGLLQWKNSLLSYDNNDLQGKQLAEPQKTAATASMSTSTYCDDNVQQQSAQHLQAEHSPLSSTSRSEIEASDSVSPVMKTRKSSSHKNIPDKDLGSPKAKNWKDLLFRRGGGSSSSGGHNADLSPSNLSSSSKTIGSIGVPLKTCPMSKNNEYVPTLVEVCTNIVETKGLGVVGIYRIPGNKAAISELSDQVNKTDFSWDRCNTDVRWEDVNVVSSLLKLFIRSLPDALLPSSFYNHFIEADKKAGMERLREIKQLLENLPRYSYETMKHLFRHLNRVSKNCDVNLMETKNLAIIFGPSIIRTPNDTLDIAVKDMKHQCRIVELLLTHYDYFFENGKTPDIEDVCGNNLAASTSSATGVTAAQQQQEDQTNMLLHNISKIERFSERESNSSHTTSRTSRFMPQLGKKPRKPGDSRVSEIKSKSFHTSTSNSITTNTNIITNTKHSITTPILLTKNTLKNICKSTPNISTLNTRSISNHNRNASKASCESAVAYRQRRKAVPTIYDFGVTLRLHFQSTSATTTATSSSSSSSTTTTATSTKNKSKKSESRSILGHRHGRKTSLDEKDSGSCSGSSIAKETQRNSVDISITLTDDESSNSRLSDTGSMSLGAVTDALEDKLKIVKCGFNSNEENGSPDFPITPRRYTIGEPLLLHSENIPYADESPERHFHNFYPLDNVTGNNLMISRSCASTNTLMNAKMNNEKPTSLTTGSTLTTTYKTTHKLQHSATAPINSSLGSVGGGLTSPPTAASTPTTSALKGNLTASTARNLYATSKNLRFSSSVQEQRCSEDDSEGSTTSDPKEALVMASPSFLLDKYNKKRRDHRLFRSASFNCRNYSSRYGGSGAAAGGGMGSNIPTTGLTKDEKTDMNLTKKRQIQNKQNRSIKRRHTVGGPHDYSGGGGGAGSNNCNHHCKNISNNGSNNSTASNSTTVVRRIPLSSANGNIPNNNNNNNNNMQHDEGGSSSSTSNGNNSSSSNSSSSTNNAATVNVANSAGEHVLEVGIRIKNINRGRF